MLQPRLTRLLLLSYADVQVSNHPTQPKHHQHACEDGHGLREARAHRVVVCDDEVAVAELVDNVECCQGDGCSAECIHEGAV